MKITDGDWTLIKWDADTNQSVWSMEQDGETIYRKLQPVDSIIENNALARHEVGRAPTGDYIKIASIPVDMLWNENNGLMKAFSEGDRKYTSRWLNDGDNRAWRTTEHKV